jgi:hypothetical protein
MNRLNEKSANTDLYASINQAPMTESEREVALNALRNAEGIVNAWLWVVNGVKRLIARIFEKPADLKHSH